LNSSNGKRSLRRLVDATTSVAAIYYGSLKLLKLLVPPLPEQQKIANLLSNIDNLIINTQKIIDQTKSLKQGLMQKLLTKGIGHKKFKKVKWLFGKEIEIPEEWEIIKLSSLTTLITKGSSPNWQGYEYQNNGILFITSENIGTNKMKLNNKKYLNEKFNKNQKRSILKKGDVLTNIVGASIGRSALFNLDVNANINQAVALIRLNELVLSKYLINYLNWNKFVKFMIHGTGETARPNLNLQDVGNFPIILASKDEQQKIAFILSNVDSQIQSQIQYKEKLERLKKSLMQKLLTGQVRVAV